MWHEDRETLNLLGKFSQKERKEEQHQKEKIVYRTVGQFNTKESESFLNTKLFFIGIGILITIIIAKNLFLENSKNPLIGKWVEINRNLPNRYMIEFSKDKIMKLGINYKVNYEIYKDKVEVNMKVGLYESPIGETYYIKDQNTIIEQTIFGPRVLKRIE